jgi:hypothetical protein
LSSNNWTNSILQFNCSEKHHRDNVNSCQMKVLDYPTTFKDVRSIIWKFQSFWTENITFMVASLSAELHVTFLFQEAACMLCCYSFLPNTVLSPFSTDK